MRTKAASPSDPGPDGPMSGLGLGPILGLVLEASPGTDLGPGPGDGLGIGVGIVYEGVLGPVLEPVPGRPWHGSGDRSWDRSWDGVLKWSYL